MIWNVTTDAIAPQVPIISSNRRVFRYFKLNSNAEADLLGYKIYVNGEFYKNSKTNSVTVDRLLPSTSYDFTVKLMIMVICCLRIVMFLMQVLYQQIIWQKI
jgi:hypothetical protein